MYKVHKWIAVSIGVFFLMWLISGIVMILPPLSPGPLREQKLEALDFRKITVSPSQAVASIEKVLETSAEVNRVNLRRVQDAVVYDVILKNGGSHLVDAISNQVFAITPERAERIVRSAFPTQAHVLQIERVSRHSYVYQRGPLPAYRVVFDNDQSTAYYVSTHDGTVRRSDRWSRIRGAIESLHTFEPLKLITKRDAV